jgi:AcrR family transcriptional regulator
VDNGETEEPRPRRLTRAETKARTRARLLDAAAQVFARKGFGGASVDEIAESAGYSTGALYANFGSKDELFVELLAARTGSRQAEAAVIVSDDGGSLDEVKAGMNRQLIDVAEKDADIAPLQAELWLYALRRRPELLARLADQFRVNRDSLTDVLTERGRARGQAENLPFEDLATVVLALFQGLVQLRRTDPELVPDDLYGTALGWLFTGSNRLAKEQGEKRGEGRQQR